MKKVLVIEEVLSVREYWQHRVGTSPGVVISGSQSVEEALRLVEEYQPQVLILDHHFNKGERGEGLIVARVLAASHPELKIFSTSHLAESGEVAKEYASLGVTPLNNQKVVEKITQLVGELD